MASTPMLVGCTPDRRILARQYDRADGTGLYTWLFDHEPSAIVAWNVPVERIGAVLPKARIIVALEPNPCKRAMQEHAALVTLVTRVGAHDARRRDVALDCGVALFRDSRGLVIAPR